MGICTTPTHQGAHKMQLSTRCIRKSFTEDVQLGPGLLERIGRTWWKGLSRGFQVEKYKAKAQPLFSHLCICWGVTDFSVWLSVFFVAHRLIESALLNEILSSLWQCCLNFPTSIFSFMASSHDKVGQGWSAYVFSLAQISVLLHGQVYSSAL